MAKDSLPFLNYPALLQLKVCHGLDVCHGPDSTITYMCILLSTESTIGVSGHFVSLSD